MVINLVNAPSQLRCSEIIKKNLFVISAHTSHVTQLFDVGIGSAMKYLFASLCKKEMEYFNVSENNLGQVWHFGIFSAIASWYSKTTYKTCKDTAKIIGINPCSYKHLIESILVKVLPPQIEKIAHEKEEKKRTEKININCKLIKALCTYRLMFGIMKSNS